MLIFVSFSSWIFGNTLISDPFIDAMTETSNGTRNEMVDPLFQCLEEGGSIAGVAGSLQYINLHLTNIYQELLMKRWVIHLPNHAVLYLPYVMIHSSTVHEHVQEPTLPSSSMM